MSLKRSELKVDKYNRTTQCCYILESKENMMDDICCGIPLKKKWSKDKEWWIYENFCEAHAEKVAEQEAKELNEE